MKKQMKKRKRFRNTFIVTKIHLGNFKLAMKMTFQTNFKDLINVSFLV